MTVPESLLIAFFCMAMVFTVLVALCGLIKLFSVVLGAFSDQRRQSAPISAPSQPALDAAAEFSAGVLKLREVDEPTAAMIMAIVSDESGIPLSELCFKSIKLVRSEKNQQSAEGANTVIYIVKINTNEYEVAVEKGRANIVKTTEIATTSAPVSVIAAPAPVATPAPAVAPAGANVIKAPLPGTILEIKTAPGQPVKKGDILLILEAMKMENEVVAPADGVIAQVLVAKGAAVATGDVLITLQ